MAKDVSINKNTAYRRWLGLILSAFLLLCGLNNVTLPMFEASDEAAHFAYADYWARERRLPNLRQEVPSHEAFQPPLYYVALAPLLSLFDRSNLAEVSQLNPDWFDRELNANYASVSQLHLHGPAEQFPYGGAVWAVRAARFISSLLGAATIYMLFLLANLLLRRHANAPIIALLAAALAAFNPKFVHISSIVSNDIAVTFAATLTCWWMLRIEAEADDKPQLAKWFGLGILVGLAGLCKIQAFALVIPAGVLWLSALTFSPKNKNQNLKSKILPPFCALAGFLLVSAWWFWLNWVRYGDPLAWNEVQTANAALLRPQPLGVSEIISRVPQLFISFWGVLGIEKYFPPWVDWVLFGGLALAVLGCVRLVALGWGNWGRARAWLVLLAWQTSALALFLSWMRTHVGTENSRLLMPSMALPTLLVAVGWMAFVAPRWRFKVGAAASLGMFALALSAPFVVIRPAFATPPPLSAAQTQSLPTGANVTFGGQVRLLHGELDGWRVQAGQSLKLHLFWGAVQPIPKSYRVLLEVVDLNGELIARRRYIPFQGRFATQRWQPNVYFRDDYDLPIDASAASGPATIQIALLTDDTPPQLLPIAPGVNKFVLGQVKVTSANATPSKTPAVPLTANFGGVLSLQGYDLALNGDQAALQLYLARLSSANNQIDKNYTLFVHVLDRDGKLVTQSDAQPHMGRYPTRLWEPNEQVIERREVALPSHAARIVAGWYDASNGQRLPANKPDGTSWPADAAVIWERYR